MADNKHETRKAILGELESIKDLLLDQEDIPILNDAIDIPPLSPDRLDDDTELPPRDTTAQAAQGKDPPGSANNGKTRTEQPSQQMPPESNTVSALGAGTTATADGKQRTLFGENREAVARQPLHPPETKHIGAPPTEKNDREKASGTEKPTVTSVPPRENPFLPKHIRDRLHTNRTLVDEIKDSPIGPRQGPCGKDAAFADSPIGPRRGPRGMDAAFADSPIGPRRGPRGMDAAFADSPGFAAITTHLPASSSSANAIVEELLAEFMPKIEAELRRRLEAIVQASSQKPEDTGTK